MARSLDQEGLSQTAIAKELGVPRPTITRWLKDQIGQNEQASPNVQNDLSNTKPCRCLVVCQSVEKFLPPEGSSILGRCVRAIVGRPWINVRLWHSEVSRIKTRITAKNGISAENGKPDPLRFALHFLTREHHNLATADFGF